MKRVSIKKRLTVFILLLLFSNLLIISHFVLKGIEKNQTEKQEATLIESSKTVNLFIREKFVLSNEEDFQEFYILKSRALNTELSRLLSLYTTLFDNEGNRIAFTTNRLIHEEFEVNDLIETALENQIAYRKVGYIILYAAPVYDFDKQIGVVIIEYDASEDDIFYDEIRKLLIEVGLLSIVVTFILSTFYLLYHVKKIIRLRKSVQAIEKGNFSDLFSVNSKDELGELSQGIENMANKIKRNIRDIEFEKDKLKEALDKLKKLELEQKEFIGNITHEFKTPITIIKAQLDMMTLYDDDEYMVKSSKEIAIKELKRLNNMVENILYLSSVDQYDYELKSEIFGVGCVIEEVLEKLAGKASRFGITIENSIVKADVWIDRSSLIQILINLIDNAIKYNNVDGKINIKSYTEEEAYIIRIEDTGIGVPDEHKKRIFEPFYTVDRNRSKSLSGTGLGLPLVQKLLLKQGGAIKLIESESLTIFEVNIPLYNPNTTAL